MSLDLEANEYVDWKGRRMNQAKGGGRMGAALVCGMSFCWSLHLVLSLQSEVHPCGAHT